MKWPTYIRLDKHEGSVWVAIILPKDVQEELKQHFGGADSDRDGAVGPHITLAYLGKKDKFDPASLEASKARVSAAVAKHPALAFQFNGVGKFVQTKQSDGKTPVYFTPQAKGLAALRTDIVRALEECGIKSDSPFDFVPHVCLGYVGDPGAAVPSKVPDTKWTTDTVHFMVNPERTAMPLAKQTKTDEDCPEVDTPFSSFQRGKDVASPKPFNGGKQNAMPEKAPAGGSSVGRHSDIVQKAGEGKFVLKSHEGKVLGTHGSEAEARSQEAAINIAKARAAGHHIAQPKDFDDFIQKVHKSQNVGDPDLEQAGIPERRGNKWVILKNGEVAGEYDLENETIHLNSQWANANLAKIGPLVGSRAGQVGSAPDVTEPTGEQPNLLRKDCKRYDIGQLNKPIKLPNGWLKCDAHIARTGVQVYRNPDGTERRELRLPSEVFHPDAMASFQMRPVTDEHPPEFLTDKNTKKFQCGNMGERIERDDSLVRGPMMITDGGLIKKMETGDQVQVSCGYTCDLEPSSGVTDDGENYDCIQRNIRGNHVAIVPVARAGEVAHVRMDSGASVMVRISTGRGDSSRTPPEGHVKKIRIGGKEFTAGSKEAEKALQAEAKRLDSIKADLDKAMAERVDDGDEHGEYLDKLKDAMRMHDSVKKLHDAAFALHTAAKDAHDTAGAALEEQYEEHKRLLEEQQHKSDEAEKQLKEAQAKLDAAPQLAVAAYKARQELELAARSILGKKEKLDGVSDKQLKQKIVLHERPKMDAKEVAKMDDAHLDAYFEVVMAEYEPDEHADSVVTDDVTDEFEPGDPRRFDGMTDEWANKPHFDKEEARAAMEHRHRNAWRQPIAPTSRDVVGGGR